MDDIKMDLKQIDLTVCTGFCIKTGTTGGPLRTRNGPSRFPKMQGIF